jgi:CheY-like chemotaxis protein
VDKKPVSRAKLRFQWKTPASVLKQLTRSKFLEFSNACTQQIGSPGGAWDWRSASGLWIAPVAASGSNRNPKKDRGFFSSFLPESDNSQDASAFDGKGASQESEGVAVRMAAANYILVVEDNSGDAALLRWSLKEHDVNLHVVVVTDGERAVTFIDDIEAGKERCPSLVILDLNLPRKTGREVLQHIRQSASCRTAPVAIFSSSEAPGDMEEAASLGADRYIKKPSNLDDFLEVGKLFKTLLNQPRV